MRPSQDTFSFALVLLCLAVGEIAFVHKRGKTISRNGYASGFRPTLPKSLRTTSPEIAALIEEMWLTDFRARPAMKDVVVRLGVCLSHELGGANDNDLNPDKAFLDPPPRGGTAREQQLELEILELKVELADFHAIVAANAAEIATLKVQLKSRISR